jgi:integrase
MKDDPLQTVLKRMNQRNNSDQSVARYELYIKKYLAYLKEKKIRFKDADCNTFMNFLGDARSKKGEKLSGSTKSTMFYAFKTIYKLWKKEWILEKVDAPRKTTPNQPYYDEDEIEKIIATANKISFKAAVLAHIGKDCGCRRAAIHKMNVSNFLDVDPPALRIPDVKHGRPVEMLIADDTVIAFRKMLDHRKDKNGPMFIGENGERMSLVCISNLFHKIAVRAGVYKPGAGIHAMRRGKVTRLVKAGVPEFDIVETMGWRPGSPMVHIYCQLDNKDIQKKSAAADPLIRGKNGENTD